MAETISLEIGSASEANRARFATGEFSRPNPQLHFSIFGSNRKDIKTFCLSCRCWHDHFILATSLRTCPANILSRASRRLYTGLKRFVLTYTIVFKILSLNRVP
jgi:hypothetical protein